MIIFQINYIQIVSWFDFIIINFFYFPKYAEPIKKKRRTKKNLFSRLPYEITHQILDLLPLQSVSSVVAASGNLDIPDIFDAK